MPGALAVASAALNFIGNSDGAVQAIGKLINNLSALGSAMNGMQKKYEAQNSASHQHFKQMVSNSVQVVNQMTNAFRWFSQGVAELGRTLTFYIALPLAAVFQQGVSGAVEFEAAMVRVEKVSEGLSQKGLQRISDGIREIARSSTATHMELAKMAEQLGQMGVDNPEGVLRLLDLGQQLALATDLSADSVVESMGKIANAFGYDLNTETGVRNIEKLANVINMLENRTAASADEIVDAIYKTASVANQLKIPAEEIATLSAWLVSSGVTADQAGTEIQRSIIYITRYADRAAELMKGYKEEYQSAQDVLDQINVDPIDVLLDMIETVNAATDDTHAQAVAKYFEAAGLMGGKTLALAANSGEVRKMLDELRNGVMSGKSLWEEYNTAMNSTQAGLKVLKNNMNDLGITIGAVVLPQLNQLIQFAIPVIQLLGKAFQELDPKIQMIIVALPIVLAAAAPLLFIFGQLAHSASLIGMGAIQMVKGILSAGSALFFLGKSLLFINPMNILKLVGLGAGLLALGGILKGLGVDVAGFFTRLADSAANWGANLAKSYATGFLGGAIRWIVDAVTKVARWIASFFESHSPPERGPLKGIMQWGPNLMRTFLQGFKLADFDILNDVGNIIQDILQNQVAFKNINEEDMFPMLARARVKIAEFIDFFNRTGKISKDLLNQIGQGLGEFGADVQKLLTLWVDYEKIQLRLKALEKEKANTLLKYDEEAARIAADATMSAEEKAEALRMAMRNRDTELERIAKEQKATEEQADAAKEMLDWQKKYIDALTVQEDIFARLAKALENLADKLSGAGLEFNPPGGGLGLPEGGDPIEEWKKKLTDFEKRISSARLQVSGFFDALSGKGFQLDPSRIGMDFTAEEFTNNTRLYKLGQDVRNIALGIAGAFESAKKSIAGFSGNVDTLTKDPKVADWINRIGAALTWLGQFIGGFVKGFVTWIAIFYEKNRPKLEALGKAVGEFVESVKKFFKSLGADIQTGNGEKVGRFFGILVANILGLIFMLVGKAAEMATAFIKVWTWVIDRMTEVHLWIEEKINQILAIFGLTRGEAKTALENLPKKIGEAMQDVTRTISEWYNGFKSYWAERWEEIKQKPLLLLGGLPLLIAGIIGSIITTGITKWAAVAADWLSKGQNLITQLMAGLADLHTRVSTWVTSMKGTLAQPFADVVGSFFSFGANLVSNIISGMNSVLGDLISKVAEILEQIGKVNNAEIRVPSVGSGPKGPGFDKPAPKPSPNPTPPRKSFATGGIAFTPTVAVVGDASEPEVVLRMSQLRSLFRDQGNVPSADAGKPEIHIHIGSVRDDRDIQKIADAVERVIARKANRRIGYGNAPM